MNFPFKTIQVKVSGELMIREIPVKYVRGEQEGGRRLELLSGTI